MHRFELRIVYKEDSLGFIAEPMPYQNEEGEVFEFKCGWGKTKGDALNHMIDRNSPHPEKYRGQC